MTRRLCKNSKLKNQEEVFANEPAGSGWAFPSRPQSNHSNTEDRVIKLPDSSNARQNRAGTRLSRQAIRSDVSAELRFTAKWLRKVGTIRTRAEISPEAWARLLERASLEIASLKRTRSRRRDRRVLVLKAAE